jgi:hypothetical protein
MGECDSTTTPAEQRQQSENLADLMPRSLWPIDGLVRTLLKEEGYDDLLLAMVPLLDGAKGNLAILGNVLEKSFGGPIRVETTDMIETFGFFLPDYFDKAYVPTQKEEKPRVEEQPSAPASFQHWKGLSRATLALIDATRNNIEARADRLINPDPEAPLDAAEVAKIGREIKIFAAQITKDMVELPHLQVRLGGGE